jgi:hypothetical protein
MLNILRRAFLALKHGYFDTRRVSDNDTTVPSAYDTESPGERRYREECEGAVEPKIMVSHTWRW